MRENEITEKVILAAIEAHRHLGPGLLESARGCAGPAIADPARDVGVLRVSALQKRLV
jgi:hypothetical protein